MLTLSHGRCKYTSPSPTSTRPSTRGVTANVAFLIDIAHHICQRRGLDFSSRTQFICRMLHFMVQKDDDVTNDRHLKFSINYDTTYFPLRRLTREQYEVHMAGSNTTVRMRLAKVDTTFAMSAADPHHMKTIDNHIPGLSRSKPWSVTFEVDEPNQQSNQQSNNQDMQSTIVPPKDQERQSNVSDRFIEARDRSRGSDEPREHPPRSTRRSKITANQVTPRFLQIPSDVFGIILEFLNLADCIRWRLVCHTTLKSTMDVQEWLDVQWQCPLLALQNTGKAIGRLYSLCKQPNIVITDTFDDTEAVGNSLTMSIKDCGFAVLSVCHPFPLPTGIHDGGIVALRTPEWPGKLTFIARIIAGPNADIESIKKNVESRVQRFIGGCILDSPRIDLDDKAGCSSAIWGDRVPCDDQHSFTVKSDISKDTTAMAACNNELTTFSHTIPRKFFTGRLNPSTMNVAALPSNFLACSDLTIVDLSSMHIVNIPRRFLAGCASLTTVRLPCSVERIESAFLINCVNLESLDLSHIPQLSCIDQEFMSGCTRLTSVRIPILVKSPIPNYPNLPAIASVSDGFMQGCVSLTSIDLSFMREVDNIDRAFLKGCTNLTSLDFTPMLATYIDDEFLNGCSGIKEIRLPKMKNTSIGGYFLADCSGLESLDLSTLADAKDIDAGFLKGCCSLTTLDLNPLKNIKRIDTSSFLSNCKKLKSISGLSCLSGTAQIEEGFLENCESLEAIVLTSLYKAVVAKRGFLSSCTSLREIDLSLLQNLTEADHRSLQGTKPTKLSIPATMPELYPFDESKHLRSLTIVAM
jgi:hypothetical protein